jgi:hypothetical protein
VELNTDDNNVAALGWYRLCQIALKQPVFAGLNFFSGHRALLDMLFKGREKTVSTVPASSQAFLEIYKVFQ